MTCPRLSATSSQRLPRLLDLLSGLGGAQRRGAEVVDHLVVGTCVLRFRKDVPGHALDVHDVRVVRRWKTHNAKRADHARVSTVCERNYLERNVWLLTGLD